MPDDKVIIRDLYVRSPPRWFRKIGNGLWHRVDLTIFGGRLPIVWLKPADYVATETWESGKSSDSEKPL